MKRCLLLVLANAIAVNYLSGCTVPVAPVESTIATPDYYGTLDPFASESVYFLMTDRFVDGDPQNNQTEQGGEQLHTFDRPIKLTDQDTANIGYLGGDFQGLLNNADYIAKMGFSAVWITPIVDNPDEAFTGSTPPGEGIFADQGKTGYHGYWGVDFFSVDEHLESPQLGFADLTRTLRDQHNLKLVLDVVMNHGSPAYTMPVDQPKYGELYNARGQLVADHQNLHPTELDPADPLHAFYNTKPDLAQLSDLNETNPEVLEYFVKAYTQWLDQGAAAFRVDTIKHMPHAFWKKFSDRIRQRQPEFFMFAESWSYDTSLIAQHTWPENGGISVLDFPGQKAMNEVFADHQPYSRLLDYLQLDSGLYHNPYELMTFYDNHDMARMNADDSGFIDANNWLFTSRGIPVVYYGSEMAFQAGAREHEGNRNYFGQDNIERSKHHPIHAQLSKIAQLRSRLIALQRGLQVNLNFDRKTAAFLRVFKHEGVEQTALVLLNKDDQIAPFDIRAWLGNATWSDAFSGEPISAGQRARTLNVEAHGVRVFIVDSVAPVAAMSEQLGALQKAAYRVVP